MRSPSSAALVRVKTVESAQTDRTAFLNKSSELKVAGDHDVTIYNNQGKVVGYQREVLASGETKKIDGSKDLRPRLTVKHAKEWKTDVTATTPRGGAVEWITRGIVPDTFEVRDLTATRESSSLSEDIFVLSRAGRFQVIAWQQSRPSSGWKWNSSPAPNYRLKSPRKPLR